MSEYRPPGSPVGEVQLPGCRRSSACSGTSASSGRSTTLHVLARQHLRPRRSFVSVLRGGVPHVRTDVRSCRAGRPGRPEGLGEHRHLLHRLQPEEGRADANRGPHAPHPGFRSVPSGRPQSDSGQYSQRAGQLEGLLLLEHGARRNVTRASGWGTTSRDAGFSLQLDAALALNLLNLLNLLNPLNRLNLRLRNPDGGKLVLGRRGRSSDHKRQRFGPRAPTSGDSIGRGPGELSLTRHSDSLTVWSLRGSTGAGADSRGQRARRDGLRRDRRADCDRLHQVDNPAFDREGNLYVTFSGSRGQEAPVSIYVVRRNGSREPFVFGVVKSDLDGRRLRGRVYVSSRFDGSVHRSRGTDRVTTDATDLGVACGIAFDGAGALYVGDRSGSMLRVTEGQGDESSRRFRRASPRFISPSVPTAGCM